MEFSDLFLPYAQANDFKFKRTLKSFDEKHIAWYVTDGPVDNLKTPVLAPFPSDWSVQNDRINAPLWQQVFDFYSEKFKLHSGVTLDRDGYKVTIVNYADFVSEETTKVMPGFKTELEANIARLEKLILYTT